ncbi:MAG: hypothetical protein O3A00_29400, partial [Planctomycetota bacterium]|nr:hypothetical protein [Planctomycetota bacterium]
FAPLQETRISKDKVVEPKSGVLRLSSRQRTQTLDSGSIAPGTNHRARLMRSAQDSFQASLGDEHPNAKAVAVNLEGLPVMKQEERGVNVEYRTRNVEIGRIKEFGIGRSLFDIGYSHVALHGASRNN